MIALIKKVDLAGIQSALTQNPALANTEIPFEDGESALAHPLHRICDGVFSGLYSDEQGLQMAEIFLANGAKVDGNDPQLLKDTPLVAAASLHADQLALLYMEAGANIGHQGCHGGTALHWAAWCGRPELVKKLIEAGAEINLLCHQFKSTPLFWAVHGLRSAEGKNLDQYKAIVKMLLEAGADKSVPNFEGYLPKQVWDGDEELRGWLEV